MYFTKKYPADLNARLVFFKNVKTQIRLMLQKTNKKHHCNKGLEQIFPSSGNKVGFYLKCLLFKFNS